jgi:N-succinyldiaminopimelate aminotransferase
MAMPAPKWSRFGTSIFSVMTMAAIRNGAINLAQGFPNFDGPDEIKEAAVAALRGHFNQYAPSHGLPMLRDLLASRMKNVSGLSYNQDTEITVFSGATEALFCAFQAFLNPGDEIMAFAPFFDCYPAGAFSAGATLVEIPLRTPDWTFTADDLESRWTGRTKAILVNTPHNPTGRVFSRSEMEVIAAFANKHDLLVITDEVYEELVYDDLPFTRMATLPRMRERTVVISSTAKTFSLTGWKIGYTFAPPELTLELRSIHQFTVFCAATPLQAGICAALRLSDEYYRTLRREYRERRDFLCDGLTNLGFKYRKPEGTYFVVADYSHMSRLPDTEFTLRLTETNKVALIPTSVFYTDPDAAAARQHYTRFAFCKDLETLKNGLNNLGGHAAGNTFKHS